jgi:hypothetical protein
VCRGVRVCQKSGASAFLRAGRRFGVVVLGPPGHCNRLPVACANLEPAPKARAKSPDRQHTKVMSMECCSRGSNRVGDNHSSGIDLRQVSLASDANRNDQITPPRLVAEARLQRKVDSSAVLMQLACKHDQNRNNANTVRTLSRYRCKLTDTRVCSFCKTCRNHDLVWRPEV